MQLAVHKRPFKYRLRRSALLWGLPFTALELATAPWHLWPALIVIAVPIFVAATLTGVLVDSALVGGLRRTQEPPK